MKGTLKRVPEQVQLCWLNNATKMLPTRRKDFLLRRPEETQTFLGVPVSADGGLTEKANVIHFAQGARKFTGEKKKGGKTPETFFLKASSSSSKKKHGMQRKGNVKILPRRAEHIEVQQTRLQKRHGVFGVRL